MTPNSELGIYMLILILSMAISMAITPVMMKYAALLKMIDEPDHRKVHSNVIPRVGGVGIVIGFLVPVIVWLAQTPFIISVITGAILLLAFGIWDDIKALRPWMKFIGQLIATLIVVYYGGLYVHHFPLFGVESIPEYIGKPFTVFAILGVINAVNLSDGLDGLAGGEVLISLIVIAYMSYLYEGYDAVVLAVAGIGGIFGFLRFNSHPAVVFMGDSGSQGLGFLLAVLVVYLTQNVNPVLSPALAVLLLGLPLIDSLVVFYARARRGDSLVVAAKDHLHHRLLALGFYHYESVMIIYSAQVLMVCTALLVPYEGDTLIFAIYLGMCIGLYWILRQVEQSGWRMHQSHKAGLMTLGNIIRNHKILSRLPVLALESGISIFLVAAALMVESVPLDIGLSASLMLVLIIAGMILGKLSILVFKLLMYVAIGFSVYLISTYTPDWIESEFILVYLFYAVMILATFVAVRVKVTDKFRITPMDYLVLVLVIVFALTSERGIGSGGNQYVWLGIQLIVLFYAAEFLIANMRSIYNRMMAVLVITLALFAIRGLL